MIKVNLFFKQKSGYEFLNPVSLNGKENVFCPLEVDTEFQNLHSYYNTNPRDLCKLITYQVRGVLDDKGVIFSDKSIDNSRHPIFKSSFVVFDYLSLLGYNNCLLSASEIKSKSRDVFDYDKLPYINFSLIGYFLIAEVRRIVQNPYSRYGKGSMVGCFEDLLRSNDKKCFRMRKRLEAVTKIKDVTKSYVDMGRVLEVNGFYYRVRIEFIDISALLPVKGGYKGVCESVGVEIPYKDNFSKQEKSEMLKMYSERSIDFDNYALGDLKSYDVLLKIKGFFAKVYESLGLEFSSKDFKLTLGANVAKLFETKIFSGFSDMNVSNKDVFDGFFLPNGSDFLKKQVNMTSQFLAKVHGGRCRNNRPTLTNFSGVMADIDMVGCYGESLKIQIYPVGRASVIDYRKDSKINGYLSLRKFLKKYESELIDGLWYIVLDAVDDYCLKYPQDYFPSWIPPNKIEEMTTDSDVVDNDDFWDVKNSGIVKIFKHQIKNAPLTSDGLQWLRTVATPKQRGEILDNCHVKCFIGYFKSNRVDSEKELINGYNNHEGINTCELKDDKFTSKVSVEQEYYSWYGVGLGDLFINNLLARRSEHPKPDPMNEIYKNIINSTYGDLVSPYFKISNVVVANNITARARTMAWCLEKGLFGVQTITDGCSFDLNKVMCAGQERLSGFNTIDCYSERKARHTVFKPLGFDKDIIGFESFKYYETIQDKKTKENKKVEYIGLKVKYKDSEEILKDSEAKKFISNLALNHLQTQFPLLDILTRKTYDIEGNEKIGIYRFEIKTFANKATFHGASNYWLGDNVDDIKMRGYSKKTKKSIIYNHENDNFDELVYDFPVHKLFFDELRNNPESVKRQLPYVNTSILKPTDYKRNYKNKWNGSKAFVGCDIEDIGIIREFSLNQFTFHSFKQFSSWEREKARLMKDYGQSYEMFFLDKKGLLNYTDMIADIDKKIRNGDMKFVDRQTQRKLNLNRKKTIHPHIESVVIAKSRIAENLDYGENKDLWIPKNPKDFDKLMKEVETLTEEKKSET